MNLWKLWQDASPKASTNARLLHGEIGFISYHLENITRRGSQRFATPIYLDLFDSEVGRKFPGKNQKKYPQAQFLGNFQKFPENFSKSFKPNYYSHTLKGCGIPRLSLSLQPTSNRVKSFFAVK